MGTPDTKAVKKDVSLGAWPETRDALFRLCERYGHRRVQMLYFVVKAFEEISELHGHKLSLPVDVVALKEQFDFGRTKPLVLREPPAALKSARAADSGRTRKPGRSRAG